MNCVNVPTHVFAHQEREQDAQAQHQPDRDSVLNISGEDAFMRRGRCNIFGIQLSIVQCLGLGC